MLHVFSRLRFKKTAIFLVFGALSAFSVPSFATTPVPNSSPTPSALSFREWKQSRMDHIQGKIENLRLQIGQQKRQISGDPNLKSAGTTEAGMPKELQAELETEQQALALTRELTISDYFVGYLTKQPSVEGAIKQVAGRLTPDEVAELMTAYAHQFVRKAPGSRKVSPRADSAL